MECNPIVLDNFFVRQLWRLNEKDCKRAQNILRQRLKDLNDDNFYLKIHLCDLPISMKTWTILQDVNIKTVNDVIEHGYDKIRLIRGIGQKSHAEVINIIERMLNKKDVIKGLHGLELWNVILKAEMEPIE